MKLQATATTAVFPAALVAASISLAVLLLPGAAVPPRSSGAAPALELVAGEVVAAVEAPAQAITRTHHSGRVAVASANRSAIPAGAQQHSVSVPKRTVPAHHARVDHRPSERQHAVTRKSSPPTLAPRAPLLPVAAHGRGPAKALGHLKQLGRGAGGHGKALGHSAAALQGPPAVPPGQARKAAEPDTHAGPRGHGGAR